MCKNNFENDLFFILLAYIVSMIFVLVSYHYALNFEIKGDTEEYFYAFNKINATPFPWGIEFVTSSIMWLVNAIGGDFRVFLFVCLLMWSPVVFYLARYARTNIFLFFVSLFFLLPLFMGNVLFLIRQFHAALFFLIFTYYYYKKKNVRLISSLAIILSVGSHISAIMWLVFFNKKVRRCCTKPIIIFSITLISFFIFAMQVDVVSMLVNGLIEFSRVLGIAEVDRKLLFYTSGKIMDTNAVRYPFILLSFLIAFLSFFLLVKRKIDNSFVLLVLFQSLLLLTLSANIVAANRFGFFAFYFSIPLVLILFSSCFKKIRVAF